LTGDEVIIDTVSYNGKHFFSCCAIQNKRIINNTPVYFYAKFLPETDSISIKSFSYIKKVLDAIEFRNGMAHSEVMLTPEPKLIEVNPRVSGSQGAINKQAQRMYSKDQVSIYCNNCLNIELNKTQLSSKLYSGIYYFYNFNKYSHQQISLYFDSIDDVVEVLFQTPQKPTSDLILSSCYALVLLSSKTIKKLENNISMISTFERGK
ncbi:MAG: hypothetical protein ACRY3E_05305, partial [Candidatus Lariskella arthropodorum]